MKDPEPLHVPRRDRATGTAAPSAYIRAASYGHTLGGAVGLAMIEAGEPITPAWLAAGTWKVEVAGVRYPAVTSLRPLYDPAGDRIKA